uniref:WD repeat domain 27 n=1 Tax=Serinus canaria TaxID=9135 RepID=A0A8C9MIW4_SERCA
YQNPQNWAQHCSRHPDVVCEKHLFKGKLPEPLFQLACRHHHCAFPVSRNGLCVWNTATPKHCCPLYLSGHHYSISALSFGSKINPLLVCSASHERVIVWNLDECTQKVQEGFTPRGIVIGTLLGMVLHIRFSPDDQQVAVCAGNQIYMLSNEAVLAELDGHLAPVTAAEFCTWEKSMLISVSEDRTFKARKLLLIDEENKQIITGCAEGQLWIFSLISDHNYRCVAHIDLKKEQEKFCNKLWKSGKEIGSTMLLECSLWYKGSVETSLPILLIEHCDFFFLYPTQRYFSPCFNRYSSQNTRYFWIGTSTGLLIINLANFELEALLSYKGKLNYFPTGVKNTVKDKPLVFHSKIKSSGYTAAPRSVEILLLSLSYWWVILFHITINLLMQDIITLLGHDGAVNSVGWSHDRKWLVSASEDRTLRVWSVCNKEPALILGKEKFQKTVCFAQFYFIDTFILLCCGAEFHLLSFHLDTTKDDLKRYKQRSVCKLVQKFPMTSAMEITSLSAVNEFYSYIVLTAGSNRALEVFDLNAGCSTAVIQEAHVRSVHQICQNKGSSFSTQQPEAYNFFLTTAAGDGIKLWDLRTLRCERRFEGHSSRCYPCGIAVSPCGRFIASGSDDKYAYIYEMRSSTFLQKLGRHTESVINVSFNPSSPQVIQLLLAQHLSMR